MKTNKLIILPYILIHLAKNILSDIIFAFLGRNILCKIMLKSQEFLLIIVVWLFCCFLKSLFVKPKNWGMFSRLRNKHMLCTLSLCKERWNLCILLIVCVRTRAHVHMFVQPYSSHTDREWVFVWLNCYLKIRNEGCFLTPFWKFFQNSQATA